MLVLADAAWPMTMLPVLRPNDGTYTPKTRGTVTVCVSEVPVIVRLYCPGAAVLLAVSVKLLLRFVGFCEKLAVTPLGKPAIERLTAPAKPYCGFTVTYDVLVLSWPR